MCRCWMPLPPLRWTATATRYSSRWAATKRCALHRLLRRPHPPHRPLPRLQITARRPERHRQRALRLLRLPRHPALRRGESGKGLVRHIFLRRGYPQRPDHGLPRLHPPEVPHSEELVTALREQFSDIASVLINVNAKKTNVILGEETVSLYGPGYIEDTLRCAGPARPLSPSIRSTHWPLSGSTASLPSTPSWNPRTFCSTSTAAWVPSVSPWPTVPGAHRRGDRA